MTLEGVIDRVTDTEIEGWAFDPEAPNRAVEIRVLIHDVEHCRVPASAFREDLKIAGKGDGAHGFHVSLEPPVDRASVSVRFAETDDLLDDIGDGPIRSPESLMRPRAENPMLDRILETGSFSDTAASRIRDFARDGFLKFKIEDPDFDALARSAVEDMDWTKSDGIRLQDAWQHNDAVRRIAALPEVLDILELLYGRAQIPFQTLNFQVGTQQATHTDTIHFNSSPPRFMCGVWVALEDTDAGNGALHYYPGSHALPVYDLDDLGIDGQPDRMDTNYRIYLKLLQAMIETHGLEKRIAMMKRGEAIIWAANLYHGGEPILEPGRSRHSQVTHYYFDGCAYYEPLTSNRYLGRLTRPNRRDVRTGAPIPHKFRERVVSDSASGPQTAGGSRSSGLGPRSLLKRVARRLQRI